MSAIKKYIFLTKLAVISLAFIFIYKQIYHHQESFSNQLIQALAKANNVNNLIICLVLVFINWGLEAFKWQMMIAKVEQISFVNAFKAVLSGVTTSIFTPNRVGEFGGRIVYLDRADWIKASLISVLTGIGQLLITIIVGICGFLFFFPTYFAINTYLYLLIAFISSTLLVSLLFMFLNIAILESIVMKFNIFLIDKMHIKWLKKMNDYIEVFSYYNLRELANLLSISFIRYIVFSIQFWLMLKIFGIPLEFASGMVLISVVFFCMTIIPTFAITEVGVRTSVAVFIIGSYYLNQNFPLTPIENLDTVNPGFSTAVILSSFSLWLINLALPALIGSFFILRLRLKNFK